MPRNSLRRRGPSKVEKYHELVGTHKLPPTTTRSNGQKASHSSFGSFCCFEPAIVASGSYLTHQHRHTVANSRYMVLGRSNKTSMGPSDALGLKNLIISARA
jgi:hypothetical protein